MDVSKNKRKHLTKQELHGKIPKDDLPQDREETVCGHTTII